jgi:cytoskeletal protein CcmA (bactofilin family)
VFSAVADAQSSQCPKCGGYVSLRDYDIGEAWNRGIETRGNIVVRKSGSIGKVGVRCHHFSAQGRIAADIDCSGDILVRGDAKFTGTIHCHRLRIEKGARVEFLQPVHAAQVWIEGDVLGQIFCTGPVTLEKRALLKGPIRTTSLVLRKGARHEGCVERISESGKRIRL